VFCHNVLLEPASRPWSVTGERMKSLYATLFQPVVQTVYLSQFQEGVTNRTKRLMESSVQLTNVLLGIVVLLAIQAGVLALMGDRFAAVLEVRVYLLAACLSVASAAMLYFRVFPSGDFRIFRRATIVQMTAFAVMFSVVSVRADVPVAWTIGVGEGVLLVALVAQLAVGRILRVAENQGA